jgi:hypothetical protein
MPLSNQNQKEINKQLVNGNNPHKKISSLKTT